MTTSQAATWTDHASTGVSMGVGGLIIALMVWHVAPVQMEQTQAPVNEPVMAAPDHQVSGHQLSEHQMQMVVLPPPPAVQVTQPNLPPVQSTLEALPPIPQQAPQPDVAQESVNQEQPPKNPPKQTVVAALQPTQAPPEPAKAMMTQPPKPAQHEAKPKRQFAALSPNTTKPEAKTSQSFPVEPVKESAPARSDLMDKPPVTPSAVDAADTVVVKATDQAKGAVTLRLMEHGRGPDIQVNWPSQSTERGRVWQTLQACMGMTMAVMTEAGKLYRAADTAGSAWPLNTDQWSGYVRQADRAATPQEKQAFQGIRAHHGLSSQAVPVRLFPRHQDSAWLGGLARHMGQPLFGVGQVTATYAARGSGVILTDIRLAGKKMPGNVWLVPEHGCGRG